jgi:hypothetical protein
VGTKVRYSRVGRGGRRIIWLSFAVFEEVKYRRDSGRGGGVSLFSLTFGVD